MSYIRFRKHYLHIPYLVLAVLEFAVLLGIFVVLAVAYPFAGGQAAPEDVYSSVLFAGILSLGTLAMGGYTGIVQETVAQLYFRTLVAYCFLGGIGLMLVYAFLPDLDPGSTNLFWAILLCSFAVIMLRRSFSALVDSEKLVRRVVIFGSGDYAARMLAEYDRNMRALGVRILGCVSHFYERELKKVKLDLVHPSWIVFSEGFQASRRQQWTKRIVDLTLGLFLLIITLPFMVFTAIAILLETGRPVIYSQTRVGLLGREFRIFKFRSMRQDAEKDGKAQWASANDSRVTRVGAFIRNTRLDELPQIYNVIRGDMSIVGPRPERPEFVSELREKIPYYDTRHYVRPGLMGWAQLKYPYGASVEDARGKLEYDLYYSKNRSLLMDFLIMIQTAEVVLLGKGVR